jgi:hypothetical protein
MIRTSIDTDSATHALLPILSYAVRIQGYRIERTCLYTGPTGSTESFIRLGNITRGRKHWDAILRHCFYPSAATFAAVADSIKSVKTGILEPGSMHVTTIVLGLQEFQCL